MNKKVHYIGLDVHKETIAVSIAPQGSTEVRRYGIIGGTLEAVDKLLRKLGGEDLELRVVYEAGPCGFVLCRHLRSQGIHCDLVSPSLIPKKASDRVKTDRRDADQLARLYRAGELTAIHIPDQEDEAVRDLIRARFAAVCDQRQARNRLKGFLLRLGFRYTGKSSWNDAHKRYLSGLIMPQPAQQIVFQECIHAIDDATERLERLTQSVEDALPGWKWEPVVRALMSLRGVQVITAMTHVSEVGGHRLPGQARRASRRTGNHPHLPRQGLPARHGKETSENQIAFKKSSAANARTEPRQSSSEKPTADAPARAPLPLRPPGASVRARTRKHNCGNYFRNGLLRWQSRPVLANPRCR